MKCMDTLNYDKSYWKQKPCPPIDCRKNDCKCGLKKVFLAAILGDDSEDSPIAPKNGAYCNTIVVYEANNHIYIYSSEGIPTLMSVDIAGLDELEKAIAEAQGDIVDLDERLLAEIKNRQDADNVLQGEIDDIKNSPDVVDIVPTYAALQTYDISKLGDNDIVRVLQDEQHDGQSTYYRWNATTQTWTYIGSVGDYYTKGQVDDLLDAKQDVLTAGANITIDANNEISATNTTYTAGANVQISAQNEISATDTTYSDFTGTDGQTAGTAGLVPAPATTDVDKFLKSDGTWDTAGGGPTVVQSTGTSTTDVMSQNAVTSELYPQYLSKGKGVLAIGNYGTIANYGDEKIGIGRVNLGNTSAYALAINSGDSDGTVNAISGMGIWSGAGGSVTGYSGVAIGPSASVSGKGGIAIGRGSSATSQGEFNVGTTDSGFGYNNTNYRLISGVHDPVNAHDAATKGYVDNLVINYATLTAAGAPTTSTVATSVGQLYYDSTNDEYYYCSAIDTTDPSNPSYTWTLLPLGGGGPTVVQTTGTSTTDVMSQKAVSNLIYPMLVGQGLDTTISIRGRTEPIDSAAGLNSIGIGPGHYARGGYCVGIGNNATIYAAGNSSVAIGNNAKTEAHSRAVALGNAANAAYNNSIAIGTDAVTSREGEMNIGAGTSGRGYNSTNYRVIGGVHDGQLAQDAVTVNQVNSVIDAINTALSTNIPHIGV